MPSILNATTNSGLVTSADNSGSLQLQTNNGTTAVTIDTSQNVGVGTGSPNFKLQITGANNTTGGFADGIRVTSNNGTVWKQYTWTGLDTSDQHIFAVNGTERMRIDSSGNLLVGTTSTSGTSNGFYCPALFNFTSGAGANTVISSDGLFRRSTSSLKYKKDVQDATHGLAEVLQLRPVTYKGKAEFDGDKVFGGLIAEEVHEAGLTEFVQYADDGSPDALAYGNMVSLCVKAIQELKAELDATKAEVQALKGVA